MVNLESMNRRFEELNEASESEFEGRFRDLLATALPSIEAGGNEAMEALENIGGCIQFDQSHLDPEVEAIIHTTLDLERQLIDREYDDSAFEEIIGLIRKYLGL